MLDPARGGRGASKGAAEVPGRATAAGGVASEVVDVVDVVGVGKSARYPISDKEAGVSKVRVGDRYGDARATACDTAHRNRNRRVGVLGL